MCFCAQQRYHGGEIKPGRAPKLPGNTEAERFDNAVRAIPTVPKEALLKAEGKWRARTSKNRRMKKLI
jgi:hypothetical protein